MREYFNRMLSSDPRVSSKRVITFMASILVFIVVLVDLFTDQTVSDYVFEGLIWMAIAGLGSTAVEAFSKRFPRNSPMDPYGPYGGSYGGYPPYNNYPTYTEPPADPGELDQNIKPNQVP